MTRFADQIAAAAARPPHRRDARMRRPRTSVVVARRAPGWPRSSRPRGPWWSTAGRRQPVHRPRCSPRSGRPAPAGSWCCPTTPTCTRSAAAAAEEARAAGIRVGVVPTRSPVQALAALAVRDAGRAFDDDVIAMAEAAGACRYAEVTVATREALTVAGRCQPGDVLGAGRGRGAT